MHRVRDVLAVRHRESLVQGLAIARQYALAMAPEVPTSPFQRFIRTLNLESNYPPLVHISAATLILMFGYSIDIMAATSTLAFLLLILGVYCLARQFLDPWHALFAAFVAAFTPLLFAASRYGILENMAAPFVVWAMVCLTKTDRFRNTAWVVSFTYADDRSLPVRLEGLVVDRRQHQPLGLSSRAQENRA